MAAERSESCLYTLLHAPSEQHDRLLREFVAPIVGQFEADPRLDSYFFARYSEPEWQLRFRMLGRPELIDGEVRSAIESRLPALLAGGLVRSHEFAQYQREWDRYGGPSGMLVCEQIFRYDAALCLTILALEQTAESPKSRRELSLLFTERFLDLFGMTDGDRKAFHEYAYSWTLRQQEWGAEELAALERKFLQIESGLRAALTRVRAGDRMAWGSLQLADAVERALGASAPQVERLLELRRKGELSAHLTPLIWSLTHMHCNRLGIDAHAEAIVRYFSGRLFGPSTATG